MPDTNPATHITSVFSHNSKGDTILETGLKAGLYNRMINLIALCGIIGPGVFIGMGTALATCGPAGLLAGFGIVGILVLSMMNCIGELNAYLDLNFCIMGAKLVSPGFGATTGIFYVILWITNIIQEYTSLTSAMQSYSATVPTYGWFLIFYFAFTLFQLLNVSWWGAAEYVLGFTKLAFLTGFYVFAIIYAAGGIHGHSPGNPFHDFPLNGGFRGIANSFVYAGVYYSGVEGVSIIAAEARNPRKAIPTAVRNTVFRIFFVYFGLSVFYGVTVPYNDEMLNGSDRVMRSPMTIAMTHAGWANSRYLVTTFIWITCFSSINTAIYFASRTLYTMAIKGYVPKVFTKRTQRGVPWVSIHFCHIFGFLSILSYSTGSSVAYSYIANVAGVATFIVWLAILVIHIRFRQALSAQNIPLDVLPFKAWMYPWTDYFSAVIGALLILVQGWTCFSPFNYKTFIDDYIMLPLFPIFWFLYDRFYFKQGFAKASEVDLVSDKRADLDDIEKEVDDLSGNQLDEVLVNHESAESSDKKSAEKLSEKA